MSISLADFNAFTEATNKVAVDVTNVVKSDFIPIQ